MRILVLIALLAGCERAPQQNRERSARAAREADRVIRPLPMPLKPEHHDIVDRMLTSLVFLDTDVSDPRVVPDCRAAANVVDVWLRNNEQLRGQMSRVIDETNADPPVRTWLASHVGEKMRHAASRLFQWAHDCAQEPAFRSAFARLPIVR